MSLHTETGPVVFILHSVGATRQSLALLFGASGWRTEAYTSAREFLSRPHAFVPSCLVLDAELVDMGGFELQKRLADSRPDMAIVFVADGADVAAGVRAIKAGAVDFLTMPFDEDEVLCAVDQAIERSGATLARDAELRRLKEDYASLSGREREVMALVTSGLLNKQVGGRLGISEITVKAHRGQVMRKMASRSFADLVNKAARLDLNHPRRVDAPQLRGHTGVAATMNYTRGFEEAYSARALISAWRSALPSKPMPGSSGKVT